jgi:DNA-binding response OmpR family regulator
LAKILVVEDDIDLATTLHDWLKAERYLVDLAHTVADARNFLAYSEFDLVLLDWELPDGHGVKVCQELRMAGNQVPVLMLTGRTAMNDKLKGLDTGADDYLTKPFDYHELLARIRSLLRRLPEATEACLKCGEITLYENTRKTFINDSEVRLLRKEFDVLQLLMNHPGQYFTTEMLLARLWEHDPEASANAVFACMSRLRKKVNSPTSVRVESTPGFGYRIKKD